MDICVVSTLGILEECYYKHFLYMSLCRHKHSFLLGINLGVELLSYTIGIYLPLVKTAKWFFIAVVPFYLATHGSASCSLRCPVFSIAVFVVLATLM